MTAASVKLLQRNSHSVMFLYKGVDRVLFPFRIWLCQLFVDPPGRLSSFGQFYVARKICNALHLGYYWLLSDKISTFLRFTHRYNPGLTLRACKNNLEYSMVILKFHGATPHICDG